MQNQQYIPLARYLARLSKGTFTLLFQSSKFFWFPPLQMLLIFLKETPYILTNSHYLLSPSITTKHIMIRNEENIDSWEPRCNNNEKFTSEKQKFSQLYCCMRWRSMAQWGDAGDFHLRYGTKSQFIVRII